MIENETNQPIRLYDLMDFNKAFHSYETIEGANCLTTVKKQSQMEAVKEVGLNQIQEILPEWFDDEKTAHMFFQRLKALQY